jgi:uncharacterized protein
MWIAYHPRMPSPIRIDRATARRFLVTRHLLAPPRSLPATADSVRVVVDRLGSLQFDPLDVTGRNHDLVLAARIADYRRDWTDDLLYRERWLYEAYNKGLSLLPTAELPLYRDVWDRERAAHAATTFEEHADLVAELLDRVRRDGPLSSTDVEPRAAIDWYWRPTNQVRAVLEALAESGILALARRDGNRRLYDLAERLFPPELLAERRGSEEQLRHRVLSRHRAHGLLGASGGQQEIWINAGRFAADRQRQRDALLERGALVPVEVDGVRGVRLVLGSEIDLLEAARGSVARNEPGPGGGPADVAFLAPLDPLVWDRGLLRSLFEFDYVWEVYVPAAKRRWGYYVLPILWGDRLVGRIEPRFDRRSGALRILGLWWEPGFDPIPSNRVVGARSASGAFADAFARALIAHARFGGSRRVVWPRIARHRAMGDAVRAHLGRGAAVADRDARQT